MSLAEVDGKNGFRIGESSDAPDARLQIAKASSYEPDALAYKFDPANDEVGRLRGLIESGNARLDSVTVPTIQGRRESFSLDEAESAAWWKGSVAERYAIGNRKIREKHQQIAESAIHRHKLAGARVLSVTPEEEACLREIDAVRDDRIVREDANGKPDGYREVVVLREDFFDAPLAGDGAYGYMVAPTQREFLPRGGPALEQQTISDRWDALAKTRFAYVQDPIVRHGCHILADFVLGRGVDIIAKHPAVQRVVDEFMQREQFNGRLHPFAVSLSRDGDVFERIFRLGDGRISVGELHPATIWEISTDPEDVRQVYAYWQREQTRTQMFSAQSGVPMTRWIERVIPAADVIHVKINASQWDVFGHSDIYPALGWAKRLRDYFDAAVQKEQAAAAYQWHYQVQGGAGDVSRITAAVSGTPPPPGSNFVTNAAVDVKAVASGANAAGKEGGTYESLINHIAVSFGLSKDYFGAASRNSRASALIATEPAAKRFEQRQGVISAFISDLMNVVVAEAKKHGALKAQGDESKEIDESFRVVFPTIITADSTARFLALRQAYGMGVIGWRRFAEECAAELEIEDFNADDEAEAIKKEIDVDPWTMIMKDVAPVKRGEPDKADVAFDPTMVPNPAIAAAAGTPPAVAGAGTGATYDPASSQGRAAIMASGKSDGARGLTESEKLSEASALLAASGAIVIRP